jgi:hypothetical protein
MLVLRSGPPQCPAVDPFFHMLAAMQHDSVLEAVYTAYMAVLSLACQQYEQQQGPASLGGCACHSTYTAVQEYCFS